MRVRKVHLVAPLLMLAMWQAAASRSSEPQGSNATDRAAFKLKSVELDHQYTIEVPDDFTVSRMPDRFTSAPTYSLSAPSHLTISVVVLSHVVVAIDEKTGLLKLPIGGSGGPLLTSYFKIREGLYAYYGWDVTDEAYECTMNSPCPHPISPEARYTTQYVLTVFDKPNNTFVRFTGSHSGPSKKVTEFQGDGKLLRDIIVPSLAPIH